LKTIKLLSCRGYLSNTKPNKFQTSSRASLQGAAIWRVSGMIAEQLLFIYFVSQFRDDISTCCLQTNITTKLQAQSTKDNTSSAVARPW